MITDNCSTTEIVQAIQIKPQWTVWIVAVGWIDSQPANHTANRRSTRTNDDKQIQIMGKQQVKKEKSNQAGAAASDAEDRMRLVT